MYTIWKQEPVVYTQDKTSMKKWMEYCDTISLSYAWIDVSESKLASVKPYSLDVYITEIVQQLISIH